MSVERAQAADGETKKGDSFVRWQKYTIDQLTYAVGLILTLSTASLGFAVSLLINKDFPPSTSATSCAKTLFLLNMLALLISIGLGIFCVVSRLYDFRATKDVARRREKGASEEELEELRLEYEDQGRRTWKIFWWQIGMFAFAILTFILSIAIFYQQKLF
jgi:hypothetical protein